MNKLLFAMIATALSGAAAATNTNTGCQGNCPSTGGTSTAVNSHVSNHNTNANFVTSRNTNVNANRNSNRNTNRLGQTQTNGNNANSNASSSDNANNAAQSVNTGSNVSINYDRPAATAYAPTPVPTSPCLGSAGVGAQTGSWGFSLGGTARYEDCMRQEKVKTVIHQLNDVKTAEEIMCADPEYREARERVKRPCARLQAESVAAKENGFDKTDPYIRNRLGLPPLK